MGMDGSLIMCFERFCVLYSENWLGVELSFLALVTFLHCHWNQVMDSPRVYYITSVLGVYSSTNNLSHSVW